MSGHVLLDHVNLVNELGKRDKMRSLSRILNLFRNKFNKFFTTRAGMFYQMTFNNFEIIFMA